MANEHDRRLAALAEAQKQRDARARQLDALLSNTQKKQTATQARIDKLEGQLAALQGKARALSAAQAQLERQRHAGQLKALESKLAAERDAWERGRGTGPSASPAPDRSASRSPANFVLEDGKAPERQGLKERGAVPDRRSGGSLLGELLNVPTHVAELYSTAARTPPIRESVTYTPRLDPAEERNMKWTDKAERERGRER